MAQHPNKGELLEATTTSPGQLLANPSLAGMFRKEIKKHRIMEHIYIYIQVNTLRHMGPNAQMSFTTKKRKKSHRSDPESLIRKRL